MSDLRVRFAPSPTGYLHVGGARTALFNWLLARKQGGTFILRIEDTDVERSTKESVDAILQGMEWLGLDWDEGPFYQSENFPLYKQHVQQLLDEGKAYRCYCSPEELEARREQAMREGRKPKYDGRCRNLKDAPADKPSVVRFLAPQEGSTSFDDLIKGTISFPNEELDDLIIQRSDGTPTYNFCVVIDDASMRITTVIRGDDHVNNTPRQIQLYQALGFPVPQFAHVPMILGSDKARLSKRHGATSVIAYRDMGFLPEALNNYLVRLGWSHGDDEIFSRDEMVAKFDIGSVGRSASVFNSDKLLWLNAHYIKSGDPQRLSRLLLPFLAERGIDPAAGGPDLAAAVTTLQERARTMLEMADAVLFYYRAPEAYDQAALAKFEKAHLMAVYGVVAEKLAAATATTAAEFDALFKEICTENGWKMPQVGQPVRIALSGGTQAPGIGEMIVTLGTAEVVRRIERARQAVSE
ncbi:glutamate--tRNA ligase [Geobacter sp. SVR]|uniref:glutamate--tRNA ligase n=1 Tax=Geobacter sp. SVR TaxID=2495594 RepID=UPI00143F041B|nr:glutamate--tRNA ligase [Geobacter sp. SVR]BCS55702.1 glutamate--tRNA ligase [Geobacter sp. SVR]GCF83706.1 glutamate--tRNA ligase [Geobacter sp. SVR]